MNTKSGEVPPTDLEAEIDTLRELNTLRVESGTLRNEGIKVLTALMKQGNKWFLCSVNIRFLDDLKKNMLSEQFRRKVANHNVPLSPLAIIHNLEENKKWQVIDGPQRYFIEAKQQALNVYKEFTLLEFLHMSMALWESSSDLSEDLKELIKESMKEVEGLELKKLFEHPLPLLMAARAVQALTTAPGSTFTKSLPYCYYLIIRELYTADAPDWTVGGTRANPDSGMVSAFVTGVCARALLDFVHVIKNTSDFIAKIGAIQKRVDQLERMQTSFRELQEWALMEKKRLKFSLHTTIRNFSRHLVLQLPELPDDPYSMDIEEYIAKIAAQVVETAKNVEKNFEVACTDIQGFREKESKMRGKKTLKFERSQAGHIIAESAIKRGQKNAQNIGSLFRSSGGYKEFKKWEDIKEELKNISDQVRVLLPPVKIFLSSVLDRELMAAASGSYGEWDVVEIACSAAAYGAVTEEIERWEDDRLCRVVDCLKKVISDHGRFPIRRPFHVDKNIGSQHFPYNSVVQSCPI